MCGIAGAIGYVDESTVAAVGRMNESQVHRGPDDGGLWHTPPGGETGVVLAHRRLAILDLSPAGAQPMVDEATGNVLVFNGEIYNYADLRRELIRAGAQFKSNCDTEVLLQAYCHWGETCLTRLRGMFAFVIWDAQRKLAFCARDRIGIKPLYYIDCPRPGGKSVVLFASELRALLASGLVERVLDPRSLSSYAWNGFVAGQRAIVKGVQLLPAGAMLRVNGRGECGEPQEYWRLPDGVSTDGDPRDLHDALAKSVELRLVSDVPLGVFLSGGVDSSSVTAMAMREADIPVRTFNIAFEEAEFDEAEHARAVAKALGTDHHEVRLRQSVFSEQLDDALNSIDQPTFDAINTYFVSRAVREAGITVALSGAGGDELFGGYYNFGDIARAREWGLRLQACPERLLRGAAHAVARVKSGKFGEVAPQTRWGKLGDALAARGRLIDLYQVSYSLFSSDFHRQLLAETVNGDVYGLPSEFRRELTRLVGDRCGLHEISMVNLSMFMGQRLLRDTDAASMAVSLEVRVPLLDHEVVERAASIDPARRFEPLGRKQILRDLALGDLDRSLFERPRSGFVLPIDVWCREQLLDEVGGTLRDHGLCESAGLNGDAVARLWNSFQGGAPGVYWSRVWAMYTLLWWCNRHKVTI